MRRAQAGFEEPEGEEPGVGRCCKGDESMRTTRLKALPPGVFEESPLISKCFCLTITWDL